MGIACENAVWSLAALSFLPKVVLPTLQRWPKRSAYAVIATQSCRNPNTRS